MCFDEVSSSGGQEVEALEERARLLTLAQGSEEGKARR